MAFKPGLTVDLCMVYLLMLVLMTSTLVQGHSGSEKIQSTHQRIKLATTVDNFYVTLTLKMFTWLDHLVIHML